MSELIPLSLIDPNPFQPREAEDPEHVANVAISIVDQGLLQTPVGRRLNGRVQLAFGHTRLAAYKLIDGGQIQVDPLRAECPECYATVGNKCTNYKDQKCAPHTRRKQIVKMDYEHMPVVIQDLDDQQMFELAITENLARKNLTPIEEARAMKTYKEKFGKTSVEIGKLFGFSDSAVRNKLRLLDLPETVQEKVAAGEITEGTARKLMVLEKVAPERVENITEQITSNEILEGQTVSGLIQDTIEDSFKQKRTGLAMWNGRWNKGEPHAGTGLWPLSWTPGELPAPSWNEFQKIYDGPDEFTIQYEGMTNIWKAKQILNHALRDDFRKNYESILEGAQPFFDLLDQFTRPPACTACRFHSAIDGIHYCQIKVCWQNKRKAWYEAELDRISQEMGISIYDKDADGKDYESCATYLWEEDEKRWQKYIDEKVDHLRVRIKYQEWKEHSFTKSNCVEIISVRDEYQKKAEKQRLKEEKERAERKAENDDWKIRRQNQELTSAFMWEYASKFFVPAFEKIKSGVLPYIAKEISGFELNQFEIPDTPKERDEFYRRFIAYKVMDAYAGFDEHAQGPVFMADYLMGIAKTWGIDLPDEFSEVAHEFNIPEEEPA